MHELSIAQSIVSTVSGLAHENRARKVTSVTVEIGPLAGIVKDSLEFCFPMACEGTVLEKSQLIVDEKPLVLECDECGKQTTRDTLFVACDHCHSAKVQIISGKEFLIKSMEVE